MIPGEPHDAAEASMEEQLRELYAQRQSLVDALGTAEADEIVRMVRSLEEQLADYIAAYGTREPLPAAGTVELLSYVEMLARSLDELYPRKFIEVSMRDGKPWARATWSSTDPGTDAGPATS
jgi:hypothetical protein